MKANPSSITHGILTAIVVIPFTTALAIEPPPDNAQPPAELLGKSSDNTPVIPEVKESLPFLGVVTEEVPSLLADHLALGTGEGVVIRTVCPESPAEKAGLSVNDVILKIADHEVGTSNQVTAAVRKYKVGDRIALDLIHKGKPSRVELTLIERPADDNLALRDQEPLLEGLREDHAARLRDLIERNLDAFEPQLQPDGMLPDARMDGAFRMLRDRMNKNLMDIPELQIPNGGFQQESTIRLMDNEGSIEMKTNNGKTEVTVRDTDNAIVWSGDWNTEEDKAAAPQEVRDRIDRIQNGNGFSFRFGIR